MNREDFAREVSEAGLLTFESKLPDAFDRSRGAMPHYLVFTQSKKNKLDVEGWRTRARSFFAADLGLAIDKVGDASALARDAALVMIHGADVSGTRLLLTRETEPNDLDLARDLEAKNGGYGLALLAERCPRVWLVAIDGEKDRAALLLTAVIGSFELGPIVDPACAEIFGVRTARQKYEALGIAYR